MNQKSRQTDKKSEHNEDHNNCKICEAIKEGRFSAIVGAHNNNQPGLNTKTINNGRNTATPLTEKSYSHYAGKILQLQKKVSQQVGNCWTVQILLEIYMKTVKWASE